MTAENRNFALRAGICILLAAIMVVVSELAGEKEIIFPEITALTVGAIVAPKQSWQVSRVRMVLLIAVCSVLGILIVRYSPLPKAANLIGAFLICQVLFLLSRTSFAPMISAAALPVLMDTETIIYPISAVTMTLLTVTAQFLLEKFGRYEHEEFTPLPTPDRFKWLSALLRTATAAVLAVPVIHFGVNFCVAPPLLVAFTEFSNPAGKARSKPVKTVFIITGCALSGGIFRLVLCELLPLPLTVAAILSVACALVIMRSAGQYIPPAGALAVLPMIIPAKALLIYPAEIFAGASLLMLAALAIGKVPAGKKT